MYRIAEPKLLQSAMMMEATVPGPELKKPTANLKIADRNLYMSAGVAKKPAGAPSPSAWKQGVSAASAARGAPARSKRRTTDRTIRPKQSGTGKNGFSLLVRRPPRGGATKSRYIFLLSSVNIPRPHVTEPRSAMLR